MNDEMGVIRYMEMSGDSRIKLKDNNVLRSIKAALDNWERSLRGAKEPDELFAEYVSEIREGTHSKWPDKDLMKEVKSVLSRIEDPSIVKFVGRNYSLGDREAFWLCLGLMLGGKAVIEMFNASLEDTDEAISKK